MVSVIVHIGAFSYRDKSVLPFDRPDFLKQFMLAEIAAVFRILAKALNIQLLGLAYDMTNAVPPAKFLCLLQFTLWEGAGVRRDGDGPIAQHIMRDAQQKGRIHPAGKRHRHTAKIAQIFLQSYIFFRR